MQSGSVPNLYFRGTKDSSKDKGIERSAAPNLRGNFYSRGISALPGVLPSADGVLFKYLNRGAPTTGEQVNATSTSASNDSILFDANAYSAVYGRYSTSTIQTDVVNGVWLVRASGGFVAANTSWSVINGDATRPADGGVANAGDVKSQYKIAGSVEAEASLKAVATMGGTYSAALKVTNATAGSGYTYVFDTSGQFEADKVLLARTSYPSYRYDPLYTDGTPIPDNVVGGRAILEYTMSTAASGATSLAYSRRRKDGVSTGQLIVLFPSSSGTLALQGTSGLEYKHSITDADSSEVMARIDSLRMVNFIYNDDEQNRVRYGIIAEEAEQTCPQYIKHNQEQVEDILDDEGNKIGAKYRDRPSVDVNPIVMDLLGYVKALRAEIDELKAALKS
ncbi:MAG: tail fiber domain-containing protein [Kluyvera sp.]|uniref:tail fiber domain-containing protein n=1 Tax=Kluyvera sp. TaxID=1538228 RepID=UPI003A88C707